MKLRLFPCCILAVCLLALVSIPLLAQAPAPKAADPVLITSCGQSPGPNQVAVLAKRAGVNYQLKLDAEASDLASKQYKSVIVVTGASLKGMGAAGVSITEEIARVEALIAAAKKQGVTVIAAHVEGMSRRAAQAAPGDNSDEMSIDAVCPKAAFMIVRKDGDTDGRFTTLSKTRKVPLVLFEKNMELTDVLKNVFAK
ncbi:MAG: DUF6305 family protein [Bacteroidales bacterium]